MVGDPPFQGLHQTWVMILGVSFFERGFRLQATKLSTYEHFQGRRGFTIFSFFVVNRIIECCKNRQGSFRVIPALSLTDRKRIFADFEAFSVINRAR